MFKEYACLPFSYGEQLDTLKFASVLTQMDENYYTNPLSVLNTPDLGREVDLDFSSTQMNIHPEFIPRDAHISQQM